MRLASLRLSDSGAGSPVLEGTLRLTGDPQSARRSLLVREIRAIEGALYDERRVQDAVLALMHLDAHADTYGWRAWKTFPWEATDGLHERGLIDDPRSKAKTVAPTDEGARLAQQLFTELFEVDDAGTD